jgi:hypothetical protein
MVDVIIKIHLEELFTGTIARFQFLHISILASAFETVDQPKII